jgi:hypothetical protein
LKYASKEIKKGVERGYIGNTTFWGDTQPILDPEMLSLIMFEIEF